MTRLSSSALFPPAIKIQNTLLTPDLPEKTKEQQAYEHEAPQVNEP